MVQGVYDKTKYDFGKLPLYDADKVKYRKHLKKRFTKRMKTNIETFDKFINGLPYSLIVFYGMSGTGKSLLAKSIAKHVDGKVVYIMAESKTDNPFKENKNIVPYDYTSFRPNWQKAKDEVLGIIADEKADLCVIDSATHFFGQSQKAIEESDLRVAYFELAKACEHKLPIIAITQVRGTNQNFMYPAGGQAISHAASLLMKFKRLELDDKWSAERFGVEIGSIIYTCIVIKDKEGMARQNQEYMIKYDDSLENAEFVNVTKVVREAREKRLQNSG